MNSNWPTYFSDTYHRQRAMGQLLADLVAEKFQIASRTWLSPQNVYDKLKALDLVTPEIQRRFDEFHSTKGDDPEFYNKEQSLLYIIKQDIYKYLTMQYPTQSGLIPYGRDFYPPYPEYQLPGVYPYPQNSNANQQNPTSNSTSTTYFVQPPAYNNVVGHQPPSATITSASLPISNFASTSN